MVLQFWKEAQSYMERRGTKRNFPELLARRPRILIDDFGGTQTSTKINPFALSDAGAELVAEALFEALTDPQEERPVRINETGVTETWQNDVDFATGPAPRSLNLERKGDALASRHETPFGDDEANGLMTDNGFNVQAFQVVEGLAVSYRFVAKKCSAVKLTAYVELGAALSHAIG